MRLEKYKEIQWEAVDLTKGLPKHVKDDMFKYRIYHKTHEFSKLPL